jgi:catechol 2,3-dioxygenase-like lactoylglutathione lyase family enzyme
MSAGSDAERRAVDAGFSNLTPVFPVRDLGAAVVFYTERLGFTFVFGDRVGAPLLDGRGAPGYAGVRRDGVELHLQWQDEEEFRKGGVGPALVRIRVADLDALFDEYAGMGVFHERTRLRETASGTREFNLHDPDRNNLTFYREPGP